MSAGRFEQRHLVLGGIPDYRGIHGKIGVSQNIAKAGDLLPGNLRMRRSERFRQAFHGFTDDFKLTDYGVLCFQVGFERAAVQTRDVAFDSVAAFDDVQLRREMLRDIDEFLFDFL